MVFVYPPTSNGANTAAQAAVLDDPQATYSLLYFDTQGICNSIRNLFALQGAIWKQLYPQDWENEDGLDKASTPFGVMPVLYVHSRDGSETVQIAEAKNIELYLAQKFGRLGKNSYERHLINAFVSSTSAVWDDFLSTAVALKSKNPEVKQEQTALFVAEKIPKWIQIHEQHLVANELNGHYVGDEISLADLRSAALVNMILMFPQGRTIFTPETTPGLLKVVEAINQDPKIQQWHASELYKSQRPNRAFPAQPTPECAGLNDRQGNKVALTKTVS
ncbi:hypothetical protein BGZ83_010743 [Gryganskiella cystojenkinii]|nr:hypothetical protein BGZ83_010743 [Gryganskiella cystojenkinii]